MAVLLIASNPKNLVLIIGGATMISQFDLSAGDEAVAWVLFTLIATIGVAIPVVIYLVMGDRATGTLDGLKTWMVRSNTAIVAVLLLIIGVKPIGDSITGLAA